MQKLKVLKKIKNIINDKKIGNIIIREQLLKDFPPKELRNIVDQGKELKNGIIISISTFEDKVGIAVGITENLTSNYNAVDLVKAALETLGGKGGGEERFCTGWQEMIKKKIKNAFKVIVDKIN